MNNLINRSDKACYLCGSIETKDFFTLPPIPTMDGVMSKSKDIAINSHRGQIILRMCFHCSYIGNEGYDPDKVSFDDYDFSNTHSPTFIKHTEEISTRLVESYNLYHKKVLGIGCGDGFFLKRICSIGGSEGIGIDPGFDFSIIDKEGVDIKFIRDYYSEKYASLDVDLLTCRHVLNVIGDPISLIQSIKKNLAGKEDTIVYFDVPNVYYTLGEKIIWNVVYENRSWFNEKSLKYLLESNGFKVLNTAKCWNDEYISIEAVPLKDSIKISEVKQSEIQELSLITNAFKAEFEKIKSDTEDKIIKLKNSDKRVIAWGAGARSVSFFNIFDLTEKVPNIIDINEKRHGKFLPGTGQSIVNPDFIKTFQPDLVIITNPTYSKEIQEHVLSYDINPEFWVL